MPKILALPIVSMKARKALSVGVAEEHTISLLEELGVTQRMLNLFEKHGISSLKDLLNNNTEKLLSLPNFGEKQLILLFKCLAKYHKLKVD